MYKKYIVRLSDEERGICQEVIKSLKGSSQKARRARILLKADAAPGGPAWTDDRRAAGYAGWRKAVQRTLDWAEIDLYRTTMARAPLPCAPARGYSGRKPAQGS